MKNQETADRLLVLFREIEDRAKEVERLIEGSKVFSSPNVQVSVNVEVFSYVEHNGEAFDTQELYINELINQIRGVK